MPKIIEITDIYSSGPDVFSKLTGAQLESRADPERGLVIAESANVIFSALEAGYEPVSFLMERRKIERLPDAILGRCEDVPIYTGDDALLERLTGYRLSRGILCALKKKPLPSAAEILEGHGRIAVLWDIVDPTNVGVIFRCAAGLGAEAALVSPRCCSPLHRRASRVSMGSVFRLPWAVMDEEDPAAAAGRLNEAGFFTAAFALDRGALPVDDPSLREKSRIAVILGTEGGGLPGELIAACSGTVYIPMRNGVDSLNVGAAAAVAFWQLFG